MIPEKELRAEDGQHNVFFGHLLDGPHYTAGIMVLKEGGRRRKESSRTHTVV